MYLSEKIYDMDVESLIPGQHIYNVCRDSIVGIATRYGLDGRGIQSQCGRDFSHPSRRALSPPSLLYSGYRVSFPGVKRSGRGVDHPPPSSAEVKERIELYLYSPSGPSWPVIGRTLLAYVMVLVLHLCIKWGSFPYC